MVIILTMIMVNIHEAKAKLSEYLDAIARGERVLICKRNRPVAELTRVEEKRTERRPVGLAKGQVAIPASFHKSMPDRWLDEFYRGDVFPPVPVRTARRKAKTKRSRP